MYCRCTLFTDHSTVVVHIAMIAVLLLYTLHWFLHFPVIPGAALQPGGPAVGLVWEVWLLHTGMSYILLHNWIWRDSISSAWQCSSDSRLFIKSWKVNLWCYIFTEQLISSTRWRKGYLYKSEIRRTLIVSKMFFLHKEGSRGRPRLPFRVGHHVCLGPTGDASVALVCSFDQDIDVWNFEIIF